MKKIALILVLLLGIAGRVSVLAPTARATTYYISWSSGSDSNSGTSQGSPWKTHPYMRCSAVSGYVHHAGDVFIFKGGDSWPSSCFEMDIAQGGVSGTADYYGVCVSNADFASETNHPGGGVNDSPCAGGTSWPSSSWTRPKFAADSATLGSGSNNVIRSTCASYSDAIAPTSGCNYVTIDNIEIGPWNYSGTFSSSQNADGPAITFGGALSTYAAAGVTVENMYVHDWFTTAHLTSANVDAPAYGGVYGVSLLRSSVISDAAGYFFIGSTQENLPLMGGCAGCTEASGNLIHDGVIGCSSVGSCHDNEFYNISGESTVVFGTLGYHPHVLYEDSGCQQSAFRAYNNYVHDSDPGLLLNMYYQSQIYNNVFSRSSKAALYLESAPPGASCSIDNSSAVGYVANNTMDLSSGYTPGNNGACFQWFGSTGLGTLYQENNICIPNTAGLGGFSVTHLNTGGPGGGLYNMALAEATTYGFTPANKYSPSSRDPNTAGQGANLTSSCTGSLAPLCQDTSGAPWFGGSYQNRPTGSTAWDAGAFQGQTSPSGPPSCTLTSPSAGSYGSTVTLTATCTPQGTATISSVQFYVDGLAFGAAIVSPGPYTTTLDATKLQNTTHTIYAIGTDSNAQTGQTATVSITTTGTPAGCFTSNPTQIVSQSFTSQSAPFTFSFTLTPNSGSTNDTVWNMSSGAATGYGSGSTSLRTNSSSDFDSYNGATGGYAAANTVAFVAGTAYSVTGAVLAGFNTFNISVGGTLVASGYTFRATNTSLDHWNLISDAGVYDTAKVCNFQIGSTTTLTPTPTSLAFGNVTVSPGTPPTLSVTETASAAGSVTFSSVTVSGDSSFSLSANTCTGTLAASMTCTATVQFNPTTAGAKTGTLAVNSNAATGGAQSIPLSGTGVASSVAVNCAPSSLNFGRIEIRTPFTAGPIVCTITNGPALAMSAALSGSGARYYAVSGNNTCSGTVSAPSCQLSLTYTPLKKNQTDTATLTVSWTGGSQDVSLTGAAVFNKGVAPTLR